MGQYKPVEVNLGTKNYQIDMKDWDVFIYDGTNKNLQQFQIMKDIIILNL